MPIPCHILLDHTFDHIVKRHPLVHQLSTFGEMQLTAPSALFRRQAHYENVRLLLEGSCSISYVPELGECIVDCSNVSCFGHGRLACLGIETREWRPGDRSSETGRTDLPGLGEEEHFRDYPKEGTCPTSFECSSSVVKPPIDIGPCTFDPCGGFLLSSAKQVSRITECSFI